MTGRNIVSFSSLLPLAPCFVIPVFATPGRNQSCVQDLDGKGRIRSFVRFEPDHFTTVPFFPAPLKCDVGEEGVLAFWMPDGKVLVGTRAELKSALSEIDEVTLPEFAAVEVLTLVGDQDRLGRAVQRASSKLPKTGKIYASRVKARCNVLSSLEEDGPSQPVSDEANLDQLLSALQKPLDDYEWFRLWREGWSWFNRDARLYAIARWKIESSENFRYEGGVILHLIRGNGDEELIDFSIDRLSFGMRFGFDWYSVWSALLRIDHKKNKLLEISIDRLNEGADSTRLAVPAWSYVWPIAWRNSQSYRGRLENVAERVIRKGYEDHEFVFNVVGCLCRETENPVAVEYLGKWLEVVRPLKAWVDLYIENWKRFRSPEYLATGLLWLQKYGIGMNKWLELWRFIKPHLELDSSIDVAEYWLLAARKDLSSWPSVFEDLYRDCGGPSNRLVEAAQLWVREMGSRKSNSLIEDVSLLKVSDSL